MSEKFIEYCPVCDDYVIVAYGENGWKCKTCGADLDIDEPHIERDYYD